MNEILLESCNFFAWNFSLCIMLLKSKVRDDDNKNRGCKNTTMCLQPILSLFNGLLKVVGNFIYDTFMGSFF
jgi:hypothetical protein